MPGEFLSKEERTALIVRVDLILLHYNASEFKHTSPAGMELSQLESRKEGVIASLSALRAGLASKANIKRSGLSVLEHDIAGAESFFRRHLILNSEVGIDLEAREEDEAIAAETAENTRERNELIAQIEQIQMPERMIDPRLPTPVHKAYGAFKAAAKRATVLLKKEREKASLESLRSAYGQYQQKQLIYESLRQQSVERQSQEAAQDELEKETQVSEAPTESETLSEVSEATESDVDLSAQEQISQQIKEISHPANPLEKLTSEQIELLLDDDSLPLVQRLFSEPHDDLYLGPFMSEHKFQAMQILAQNKDRVLPVMKAVLSHYDATSLDDRNSFKCFVSMHELLPIFLCLTVHKPVPGDRLSEKEQKVQNTQNIVREMMLDPERGEVIQQLIAELYAGARDFDNVSDVSIAQDHAYFFMQKLSEHEELLEMLQHAQSDEVYKISAVYMAVNGAFKEVIDKNSRNQALVTDLKQAMRAVFHELTESDTLPEGLVAAEQKITEILSNHKKFGFPMKLLISIERWWKDVAHGKSHLLSEQARVEVDASENKMFTSSRLKSQMQKLREGSTDIEKQLNQIWSNLRDSMRHDEGDGPPTPKP